MRWCQLAVHNVTEKIRRVKWKVTELWEPARRSSLQTFNNILSNFTLDGKTNVRQEMGSSNVSGRVNFSEWRHKHMWKCFVRWLSSGETGLWENTPWPMLFSHYTLKLNGWGSSGRRRKRRDWSSCWCPLDQKVRELLVNSVNSSNKQYIHIHQSIQKENIRSILEQLTCRFFLFAFPLSLSSSGPGVSPSGRRPAAGFLAVSLWFCSSEGATQHAGKHNIHLTRLSFRIIGEIVGLHWNEFYSLDEKLTARPQSSEDDDDMYGGAWCAEAEETNNWFQVDAHREVEFTGVVTQGRNSEDQWVLLELLVNVDVTVLFWCFRKTLWRIIAARTRQ